MTRQVQNNNKYTDQVVERVSTDGGLVCSACVIVRHRTPGLLDDPATRIPALAWCLSRQSAYDGAVVFCVLHENSLGNRTGIRRKRKLVPGVCTNLKAAQSTMTAFSGNTSHECKTISMR